MTDDQKYLAARFLAAYDEAQALFSASDAMMEEAITHLGGRHVCAHIRQHIAGRMAERDGEGKRVKIRDIAAAIGLRSTSQAEHYVYAWRDARRAEAVPA